jgi:ketosteroid isomerase-like protein
MKLFISSLFLLLLVACQSSTSPINHEKEIASIQSVMNEQQEAWNRGDIDAFMSGYWKSDSLRFIGKRGITYGWQSTLNNYKSSYPGNAAMGRLQFTNLTTELAGDNSAYVIGKWELFRATDTLGGHYSLLWKKINGQWLIVADHSS